MVSRVPAAGAALVVALSLTSFAGCDGPAASVQGTVTLNGQPLSSGTVAFKPAAGQGATAYGVIRAGGEYSLQTGAKSGLAPGEYIVTVAASSPPDPAAMQTVDGVVQEAAGELLTPPQYASAATSPLRRTVQPGANRIDLALPADGP